jgi:hypothetical protein
VAPETTFYSSVSCATNRGEGLIAIGYKTRRRRVLKRQQACGWMERPMTVKNFKRMNFSKTQLKLPNGMPMKGLRRNDDAMKN